MEIDYTMKTRKGGNTVRENVRRAETVFNVWRLRHGSAPSAAVSANTVGAKERLSMHAMMQAAVVVHLGC